MFLKTIPPLFIAFFDSSLHRTKGEGYLPTPHRIPLCTRSVLHFWREAKSSIVPLGAGVTVVFFCITKSINQHAHTDQLFSRNSRSLFALKKACFGLARFSVSLEPTPPAAAAEVPEALLIKSSPTTISSTAS